MVIEKRDIKASEGVPEENLVVSEISVKNKKIIKHSDVGHTEAQVGKDID